MAGRPHGAVEEIGQLIRRVRRQRGLTQAALAEALCNASGGGEVRREHVARWERGRHIPGPYWRRWLGTVLDLDPGQTERAVRATKHRRLEDGIS